MMEFHKKFYSSDIMCLVVYSAMELDELEKMVLEIFQNIENKNIGEISFAGVPEPYPTEYKGKIIKVMPIKEGDKIKFTFYFPNLEASKKKKTLQYYSHMIGHESKGSLLDLLIKEQLATKLTAGSNHIGNYFSTLYVEITLTDKGFNEH